MNLNVVHQQAPAGEIGRRKMCFTGSSTSVAPQKLDIVNSARQAASPVRS